MRFRKDTGVQGKNCVPPELNRIEPISKQRNKDLKAASTRFTKIHRQG